eukprot:s393_g2.t1
MIERDRQLQKEAKASLYRSLASDERYRMADVRQRQHDLIMHKRGERLNMSLVILGVKRQGWIFNYEDVREISEKIDAWMKAIDLTSNLGVDRSTFSQLFVDLDLYHRDLHEPSSETMNNQYPDSWMLPVRKALQDKLPYVWAHQVFDAYAKPMRLTSGDPDFGEDSQDHEGRIRSSLCVCKWDFMAVLDRLLKARFETPRDTFMTRLRAATGYLAKDFCGVSKRGRAGGRYVAAGPRVERQGGRMEEGKRGSPPAKSKVTTQLSEFHVAWLEPYDEPGRHQGAVDVEAARQGDPRVSEVQYS